MVVSTTDIVPPIHPEPVILTPPELKWRAFNLPRGCLSHFAQKRSYLIPFALDSTNVPMVMVQGSDGHPTRRART